MLRTAASRARFTHDTCDRSHNKLFLSSCQKLAEERFKPSSVGPRANWAVLSHAKLQRFKTREGHCSAADDALVESSNLGMWVKCQRLLKKTGRLAAERVKRLLTIGFEFDPLKALCKARQDVNFAQLQ